MSIPVARAADDDKLSQILIPGEDWQVAARDLQFADGLSTDADGNVYFCEMRAKPPAIYKMTPDGVKTKVGDGSRSGTRRGPDGKLYAVGTNQALVYDLATGASTVLAEKISTNDLTVSAKGFLYLTEPAKNQITLIDSKTKEVKALDRGIKSPNGIGLSPDQKTLYVSDYGTTSVYAFAVQPDGTLTDKKALMTMKAPENKPAIANGDGMTIDTAGRVYVTTAMGLQIFAPSGELLGVLPKLKQSNPMSTTFGGKDLGYLYISFGDTIYRRKVQAKGALAFEMPK
ncbi:MAG TPA: SMP-30/gluconolactonase/LRE family protein [Humisphaera sp.]|nr:SMP-30/gluconolactonase/LRE family protein [Humisphaera sp.]